MDFKLRLKIQLLLFIIGFFQSVEAYRYKLNCSSSCSCYRDNLDVTADCEFQNLEEIPKIQWTKLNNFFLSGNRISQLSKDSLSYNHLKTLNLSHNIITQLPDDVFRGLDSLEFINLDFNFLTEINIYSFSSAKASKSENLHVSIFNNPITCSCLSNAKVNTIWNRNPKIKSFLVTCVPDDRPNEIMTLERYAEQECLDPGEILDAFSGDDYQDEVSTYHPARSRESTQTPNPSRVPGLVTVLPDVSGTNTGSFDPTKDNTTTGYPFILLQTANQGVVQPWHLMILIIIIMLMLVVVISGSYIVIKRLYSKTPQGTSSIYEGKEIGAGTFRSSHKESNGHFGTLTSVASQNNGYPTMNGKMATNGTLPNGINGTLPHGTWRPSSSTEPTARNTLTRTFSKDISKSNSNIYSSQTLPVNTFVKMSNLSYSLEDEIAPKFIDQEDYPEFLNSYNANSRKNSGSESANQRRRSSNSNQNYSLIPVNPNNPHCVFFVDTADPDCLISPTSGVYYANLPYYAKDGAAERNSRFC